MSTSGRQAPIRLRRESSFGCQLEDQSLIPIGMQESRTILSKYNLYKTLLITLYAGAIFLLMLATIR